MSLPHTNHKQFRELSHIHKMWVKDRRLALDLTAVVVLVLQFLSLSSVQCTKEVWQWATLYTGKGGSGEPLMIMEEEHGDLESLGFGNAKAVCWIGVWIILNKKNFGTDHHIPLYGGGCRDFDFETNSIRFAGDPENYTRDSLTLFQGYAYGENKEVFYTDANVQMSLINSMVATGGSDWTLYKEPNYVGESYCVKFQYNSYASFVIQPYGIGTPSGVNVEKDWISSVRKGCHSSSTWEPQKKPPS